jgi:hypothetical protein
MAPKAGRGKGRGGKGDKRKKEEKGTPHPYDRIRAALAPSSLCLCACTYDPRMLRRRVGRSPPRLQQRTAPHRIAAGLVALDNTDEHPAVALA